MAKPRVLVVRAPGTNCDAETKSAFERAGGAAEVVHLNRLLEVPTRLDEARILCFPGGFSFGDDVAAGAICASALRDRLGDALRQFRDRDCLILGICNGFQILIKTGLLIEPDPQSGERQATLTTNAQARYEDRWVRVRLRAGLCPFIPEDAVVDLPIAHAEGRFMAANPSLIETWDRAGRLCARYVDDAGQLAQGRFPQNPNGATADVAGICDATGRIFALMPHPERHIDPWQHPRWTRRQQQPAEGDGMVFFHAAVRYFK